MPESGRRPARFVSPVLLAALLAGFAAAQSPEPASAPAAAAPPAEKPASPTATLTAPPSAEPIKFEASWKNGLTFQTKDKAFNWHVGGVVQYDAAWYSASPNLQTFPDGANRFPDGTAVRRGRIRSEGVMYSNVEFILELEFFNGFVPDGLDRTPATTSLPVSPTEAFITLSEVPFLGHVRIGNQKEPYSLEHMNSARYLEFMERSFNFDASPTSAFNNARNPGVSVFRTWCDDRVWSSVGMFKTVGSVTAQPFGFGLGDGEYSVTGRITGLPVWLPKEETYVSLGGAMSHRDPDDGRARFRVRDSVRSAPGPLLNTITSTPILNADSIDLYNLESAAVYGRWTYAGEYQAIVVNGASVDKKPPLTGTPCFQGYYVEVLCFLTGESRPWDPKLSRFNRVIPKKNFGDDGWGAWELGVRYNTINLTDAGVTGGRLRDVTVGLNWYWNPNAKLQFNYDYTYRDRGTNPLAKGQIHAFGTRLSYDF